LSEVGSTHWPEHRIPEEHAAAHCPPAQLAVAPGGEGHVFPQPPQFWASLSVRMHVPPHKEYPPKQEALQAPLLQVAEPFGGAVQV